MWWVDGNPYNIGHVSVLVISVNTHYGAGQHRNISARKEHPSSFKKTSL